MSRIIVTAVTALAMLFVGIQGLSYRSQAIADTNPSGRNAEAFDFLDAVLEGSTTQLGNALPRLFVIVLLVLVVGMLVLTR